MYSFPFVFAENFLQAVEDYRTASNILEEVDPTDWRGRAGDHADLGVAYVHANNIDQGLGTYASLTLRHRPLHRHRHRLRHRHRHRPHRPLTVAVLCLRPLFVLAVHYNLAADYLNRRLLELANDASISVTLFLFLSLCLSRSLSLSLSIYIYIYMYSLLSVFCAHCSLLVVCMVGWLTGGDCRFIFLRCCPFSRDGVLVCCSEQCIQGSG